VAKKIHHTLKNLRLRTSALAVASCLALSGLPLAAHAAGLGKVTVFSALGQPLRAEVELSASREELSGMKAQLASPDAFKQAGLDYATTLIGIKFSIDKRANGQSIIKLSSDKPINDPFVDMLLELNWPSGRLVREYTFLLDPPEVAARAAAQVAPALSKPVVTSRPAPEVRVAPPVEDKPKPEARPRVQEQQAKQPPAEGADSRAVKRGDTLNKIANEVKPEGVSLDQMLVGLFRANQDAFDGGNMNRLKAGKILSVPDKSALEAVPEGEAKKIVVAQSSDWNAYRRKLAGIAAQAPAKEDAGKQEATGKITAKVEDKATAVAEPKDQVKVSKTETTGSKPGAAVKRSEEDLIAKEKALKEANDRLASLEKNVVELQKLVELKNQNLAELQKQAATKAVPPVEAPKPEAKKPEPQAAVAPVVMPAPVKPESAPVVAPVAPPVVVEKAEEKPAEPAAAKPEEAKPEAKPEPKADEMPQPKPKVVAPPSPPEEPSFVDELLDDPMLLAGGGGILALLAGFFVYKRRRQGAVEKPLATSSTLSDQSSGLTANSVFRSTGGQSVDTSHTPAQTDFSQAGPGSIDTDEVDPVAEADVYMAYGRDVQAEEILLEAKQKDSKRYAIHLKLLEIYSNRKSLKQFEALATDLYSETGGVGAEWEKAAAMGLKLDPQNPLYGGAAQAAPQAFAADATVIVSSESLKNTVTMPGQLSQLADAASAAAPAISAPEIPLEVTPVPEAAASSELTSLDFDLGMDDAKASSSAAEQKQNLESTLTLPEAMISAEALDFDIGTSSVVKPAADQPDSAEAGLDFNLPELETNEPVRASSAPAADAGVADLDFDIGFDTPSAPAAVAEPSVAADVLDIGSVDDSALEFDVKLTESTVLGQPMRESAFDMSSINLDLADAAPVGQSSAPNLDEMPAPTFESAQMNTVVNPDFSTAQSETMVNPQFGSEFEAAPDLDITPSEEVATKLDLAKAYEEMGDLEGARELLQEVLKEGDATQQEKAQAILAKIGE
jgi:pilus assembly protein FimV